MTTRLLSLDVFRGLTMILLISHGFGIHEALKDNPSLAWFGDQFEHAAWAGCTLWDLIQPAFTFIVGVAIPLSMSRRLAEGGNASSVFKHVLWRAFALILLSNILSNWGSTNPLKLQFINVLCQIAFGYLLCFGVLRLPFKMQVLTAALIFVVHHALFFAFPGPSGPFDQAQNIGAVIDRAILGYNYSGFYTTINFLGNALTILFGAWTGLLLQNVPDHNRRLRILAGCATACFVLGLALEPWIPMVKRLWLGSFLFLSSGWILAAFAACYAMIESWNWRGRWTFLAIVVGTNSIFIYSFSQVLHGWLSRGLAAFTGKFAFLGPYGAIPHNLVVLCVMWSLCYWLYRRNIFFRI